MSNYFKFVYKMWKFSGLVLCILFLGSALCSKNLLCDGKNCNEFFENYLKKYNIKVPDEATKAQYRRQFFINFKEIKSFNSLWGECYKKGINRFTHLPYSGVVKESLGLISMTSFITTSTTQKYAGSNCSISSFDWRNRSAVTPVKDQVNCGSCFAFAANAAIESQILIKYGKNISLSEQYAMECIYDFWKVGDDACNGGLPSYVYYLAYKNRGLPTTSSVPYLGYDPQTCPTNVALASEAAISSYRTLSMYDESEIACMLATYGPMTVTIFVNHSLIQYESGVYNDPNSCIPNATPNHAVLLVGFDKDPATNFDYFIFKNSWGSDWGENGFFRMRKGINLCNIRSLPQQPYF